MVPRLSLRQSPECNGSGGEVGELASLPSARRHRGSRWPCAARAGFTLIELGAVMAIIGILVSFILVASASGVRRAEERATQGLISKLDLGVTDRLDALIPLTVAPNGGHRWLAAVQPSAGLLPMGTVVPWGLESDDRARVIAKFDLIRAEMPDVFLVSPAILSTGTLNVTRDLYPFNFAAQAYPKDLSGGFGYAAPDDAYLLPLGHMADAYIPETRDAMGNPLFLGPGDNPGDNPSTPQNEYISQRAKATGAHGASWTARAGFNKLLGYQPRGYDLADNDGNGFIDDLREGLTDNNGNYDPTIDDPDNPGSLISVSGLILRRLLNHTHKTARSEAMYALLVEGVGPLGSFFNRDEFTETQVRDTDGDGLPEFVDAWGEPLQFYRWPVHHLSPLQRGLDSYASVIEPRETAPLDPSNTLVAPAWWSAQFNTGPASTYDSLSFKAITFVNHFTPLADYFEVAFPTLPPPTGNQLWDRSGLSHRRAYFSRPLIVSSGIDQQLGVARLGFDYSSYSFPSGSPSGIAPLSAANLILVENTAASISPVRMPPTPLYTYPVDPMTVGVTIGLRDTTDGWAIDDITNQNLSSAAGGL